MKWQPIKTAPSDGEFLVISEDGRMWVGLKCDYDKCIEIHYQSDSYDPSYIYKPTHWMPLPQPPKE